MTRLRALLLATVVCLFAGLAWLTFRQTETVFPATAQPRVAAPVTPSPAIAETPAPAAVPTSAPQPAPTNTPEVAATRRMYGAHAPLRTPAVANPDSVENRQILQTMVTKALSRASQEQPASTR